MSPTIVTHYCTPSFFTREYNGETNFDPYADADEIPDFNVSRARKEHWNASLAKLQVQQQKKELIPVTDIKKSSFELGRAIRESLSNIADRLAPQCAGETDSQVIHRLLTEEHRNALEEIAKI